MKIVTLTPIEEQMMQLLWQLNSFYLKEVMIAHPEPKPHQNTVSTYLKILTEKGYLSTEKEGRIFKYSVAIPIEKYREFLVTTVYNSFFKDNGKEIVKILLQQNLVEKEDVLDVFEFKIKIKEEKKEEEYSLAKEILKEKDKKDKKKKKKNK